VVVHDEEAPHVVMVSPFGLQVLRVSPDPKSGARLDVRVPYDDEAGGVLERSPA